MNDTTKLPAWAQQHIEALEMRLKEAEKALTAYETNAPSKVYYRSPVGDDRPKVYLPERSQVTFEITDWGKYSVALRDSSDGPVVSVSCDEGRIDIEPRAANLMWLHLRT